MGEVILTEDNFEEEVINASGYVLVDFWAPWCGPCKQMAHVIEQIAERNAGTVKVGKVNVDDEVTLALQHKVSSIPTLVLFKDGAIVKKSVGFQTVEEVEQMWA